MTRLTGTRDTQQATMPAPSQRPRKTQRRSPLGLLADRRARLRLGTAAVLVTALWARRNRVGHCEAEAFRAVNGLPDSLYVPAWVIMQLGTLGAAPAAAGAALLAHDRKLAGRLLAAGTGTWALSKLVKQMVRGPGQRHWSAAPTPAAAMLPGSGTCPGTQAWRSPWARLPSRD